MFIPEIGINLQDCNVISQKSVVSKICFLENLVSYLPLVGSVVYHGDFIFSVFGVGQIIMLRQIVQLSKSGSQNVLMTVKQQIISVLTPKM
jgi:hypothetical protein